ncbi:UvrD-helicase domain-containing protein [uncultured Porphyromonas sp.]|uniref:UvrD-helicase domain-containing protein n=1 Tax=uncultured Porphyromonas sp. TaxID=159274 RepID=UPI0026221A24|nr:UvrD-helicase domain-containing protein [uncultured Porphyromonas sp.]
MDRKTLTVYSASAGSGKTYNLVKEFLLLLFLNHYAPHSDLGGRNLRSELKGEHYFGFQGILGVTFTKKATIELKQRILRELIRLSEVKPGEEITGISREVIKELSRLVGKTEEELSGDLPHLSEVAVKQILEDYSHFNVRTIDSFFQEVLRSLRHEITGQSVSGSYQIELNVEEAINLAIDNLKLEMDANTYSEISKVVLTLQNSSIGKEKQVDPFKEIVDIAKHLINGDEWEQMRDLLKVNSVPDIQRQIDQVIHDAEKELEKIVEIGQQLKEYQLSRWKTKIDMLQSPKDIISGFVDGKLTSEEVSTWELTKKQSNLADLVYPLTSQVSILLDEDKIRTYISACLLSDYLPYLSVLTEMVLAVEEYEHQNHLLLIPRVNQLLDQIIDGDDTPFVYDRVGVRLHHFVIDEFQDTARLQWSNFQPLIDEARSSGHENFVVGDAKQSIYAFRGTDSSNFINLVDKIKTGSDKTAEVINLPNNWRSDERIITFNNEFFADLYNYKGSHTEDYETELTRLHKTVYQRENVEQGVPDQKQGTGSGYVEISVLPDKDENTPDVETYLHSCLEDLFARGYQPGDIAILSRGNKECAEVATWLTEWAAEEEGQAGNYAFVSKSALSLTSSVVVRLLRTLIRALSFPSPQSEKLLRLMIQSFARSRDLESGEQQVESLYNSLMDLSTTGLSVYEFLLRAINLLGELPVEEKLYVNSFIDLAYTYSRRSPDLSIRQFDDWLEQYIDKSKVDMGSGELDRINVLTIHQSKGLEFPVVILPFANWDIYSPNRSKRDLRLIRIPDKDYPDLSSDDVKPGIYLINMEDGKRGLASSLSPIYEAEREALYMEMLNLLYVAFTRAKSELYVFAKPKSKTGTTTRINDIILDRMAVLDNLKGDLITEERQGLSVWRSNVERKPQRQKVKSTSASCGQVTLDSLVSIVDLKDLKVRDKYADERTDFGILIHRLMASVYSKEDVEPLLDKLHQSGRISSKDYETLLQNFSSAMKDPTYASWFPQRGEAIVRTETTIYDGGSGREQRPDRVVIRTDDEGKRHGVIIDYKLGESDTTIDAYRRQVERYAEQLRRSGVEEVTGYLWYLRSPNGIIKVC